MREKKGFCPICNKYRKLRSIDGRDDRIHGITISREMKYISYICYPCRKKVEKGIKEGKKFIHLQGNGYTVSNSGLPKNMDKVRNELGIDRITMNKAVGFIDYIYYKFNKIDKFKYHFASLYYVLKDNEKQKELEEYIKIHHTNLSIDELHEKVDEIRNWGRDPSFVDGLYDSLY